MITARVPTENGSRYLQQLCKHWGHKFAVQFDAAHGRIELPQCPLTLDAEPDALYVRLEPAEGADAERMKEVVATHLDRFAFKEAPLAFDWRS